MNILAKEIPSAGGTGTRPHPRAWEPATLIVILLVSAVGAIIGLQILTTLGMTPNTSIIGALVAMIIARIPNRLFISFRSTHVQNLVQSAMSTATFGAANGLLLPIGIPYVLNRPDLILPMFAGVSLAMILDGYLLYRMYGSALFPANAAWPQGIAAAEAIRAGDKGGQNAVVLGAGAAIGATGAWFGVPMSAFGTAFIGNVWALGMFGV
ncbi:OPT/YSL family transporter, partial [Aquamicrobium sp.]|uniref:OPT/YSL family transporter n=1 Tax=Aquamicrobium sp. TaxID=1872579 RepID=UPI002583E795